MRAPAGPKPLHEALLEQERNLMQEEILMLQEKNDVRVLFGWGLWL